MQAAAAAATQPTGPRWPDGKRRDLALFMCEYVLGPHAHIVVLVVELTRARTIDGQAPAQLQQSR